VGSARRTNPPKAGRTVRHRAVKSKEYRETIVKRAKAPGPAVRKEGDRSPRSGLQPAQFASYPLRRKSSGKDGFTSRARSKGGGKAHGPRGMLVFRGHEWDRPASGCGGWPYRRLEARYCDPLFFGALAFSSY